MSEKTEEKIPEKFGKYYTVIREIGRGGMGAVYLANDHKLKRKVAIKQLMFDKNSEMDPEDKKRIIYNFEREAIAIANLNHPKIVNVYDIDEEDENTHYIVMELIKGIPLSQVLEKYKIIAPELVLSFIFQLCDVLIYIHQHKVIHRDIKPENIIYAGKGSIKLTDFGVAKFEQDEHFKEYESEDLFTGTILYMSPEQLQNPNSADERSDLYSFAVTIYQLLTGELPFNGDDPREVVFKILTEEPKPICEIVENFPEVLDYIILKALSKDPEERQHNVEEFKRQMMEIIEYKSIENVEDFKFSAGKKISDFTKQVSGGDGTGTGVGGFKGGGGATGSASRNAVTSGTETGRFKFIKGGTYIEEYVPNYDELKWLDTLDILIEKDKRVEKKVSTLFNDSLEYLIPKPANDNFANLMKSFKNLKIDDFIKILGRFNGEKTIKQIISDILGDKLFEKLEVFAHDGFIDNKITEIFKTLDAKINLTDEVKSLFNILNKSVRPYEITEFLQHVDGKRSLKEILDEHYSPERMESVFNILMECKENHIIDFIRKPFTFDIKELTIGDILLNFMRITIAQLELAKDKSVEEKTTVEWILDDLGYVNLDNIANCNNILDWYKGLFSSEKK